MTDFVNAMVCVAGGYLAYWFMSVALSGNSREGHRSRIGKELKVKLSGFILMGLLPALFFSIFADMRLVDLGIQFRLDRDVVIWVIAMGIPTTGAAWLGARNSANTKEGVIPADDISMTNRLLLLCSGWIVYLIGYEFLFRGILLFVSLEYLDVPEAIALNAVIYAFAHLPKGMTETLGSLLFGVLLCLAVIQTGSFWTAVLLHAILACSFTYFSLKNYSKEYPHG